MCGLPYDALMHPLANLLEASNKLAIRKQPPAFQLLAEIFRLSKKSATIPVTNSLLRTGSSSARRLICLKYFRLLSIVILNFKPFFKKNICDLFSESFFGGFFGGFFGSFFQSFSIFFSYLYKSFWQTVSTVVTIGITNGKRRRA